MGFLMLFLLSLLRAVSRLVVTIGSLAVFFLVLAPIVFAQKTLGIFVVIAAVLLAGFAIRAVKWLLGQIEEGIRSWARLPSFQAQEEMFAQAGSGAPFLTLIMLALCWAPFLGLAYAIWLYIPEREQGMASLAYALQLVVLVAATTAIAPLPDTMGRYFALLLAKDVLPSAPPPPAPPTIVRASPKPQEDVAVAAPVATHCSVCGRALNEAASRLSNDYGDGRCWGCAGQVEASLGNREVQDAIDAEIEAGLRNADGSARL